MGRIWVKELTGGLDTRRLPETTPGGLLIKGQDGHINSGGEFEKRAAFVDTYTLPAGTVGLARTLNGLVVFGSAAAPVMPSGVSYQRLQSGILTLVRVLSWDLYAGKIYAVGQFSDGSIVHFYDGTAVTDWFDGRARTSFRVLAGTGASSLTSLLVDSVAILTGPISWATSNEATASAIASAINSLVSAPNYDAIAINDTVIVTASLAGTAANGKAIAITSASGLVTDPVTGPVFAGGAVSAGTFIPGTFVKTVGSKMYSVSDSLFHFSGVRQPTKWTTATTGAGFFDVSQEVAGAEEVHAIGKYQGFVAVFAPAVIIIFYVDPDPDLVRVVQVLENTGTVAPQSVTGFGDTDLFYLSDSGLRSLKARDSSNSAATVDLGVPIDMLIKAKLDLMTAEERESISGLINPITGHFWLVFPDEIFIFSFHPNAKVSAWTTYTPTLTSSGVTTEIEIEATTVFNRRVYLRAGDNIYVYGGLTTLTYDATVAKAWLPALEADKPTEFKAWTGVDVAVRGQWQMYVAQVLEDLTIRELVATLTKSTYNGPRVPFQSEATHVSPQFESVGTGPAVLSSMVLHYDEGPSN